MSEGQEAIVRIKALDVERGWHRFRATKVKVLASSTKYAPVERAERGRRTQALARRMSARACPQAVPLAQRQRR